MIPSTTPEPEAHDPDAGTVDSPDIRDVDVHDLTVDGFTHGGEGVARLDGKAVFVPGTIPGEQVRIRIVDDRKRWARGELVEVRQASPDRVVPPCPYVGACGGCDLQHIEVDAQRRLKTRVVREQLQRIGRIVDPPVDGCLAVGESTGYRHHAQLHADPDGRLGFRRVSSHDVIAIDRCLVLTDDAQRLVDQVGDGTGAQRLVVRVAAEGRAAVLTPGESGLDLPDGDFDLLLEQPDGRTIAIRGEGELSETIAGQTLRFAADAFFQVSPAGAEAIVAQVLDALGDLEGALVWDLYAGVGLLSLPIAAAGADVVAVESNRSAARLAERNADEANLPVDVLHADVAEVTAKAVAGEDGLEAPDLVVLDPPRAGAEARVLDDLARLVPQRIIYVACDVAALARDTARLTEHGYRLTRAVPLDLFPMTHHVEVVATFTR
ncbi:MAG: class I SAM-dependent RNA methyltransferase [Nitriliruptoraceae bacterium]